MPAAAPPAVSLAVLLAEDAARRARVEQAAVDHLRRWGPVIARLRDTYHDQARAMTTAPDLRIAVIATRRASKTYTLSRELMARALERRSRFVYCHETREEARGLIWRGDTRDGWRDLVEDLGMTIARTRAEFETDARCDCLVNETDLTIEFRNGSQLAVFCADRAADADKLRGREKDGVVVDEAQKFRDLEYFVEQVAEPLLAKPAGQRPGFLWLFGTPSVNLAGLFFETTKEPEQGQRKAGWRVFRFTVTDNPYFGATAEERWEATAGRTLREKKWDPENPPPQFVREWLGRWVATDAMYVYAVHAAPPELFAPCRVADDGRYDHARAMADLPAFTLDDLGRRDPIDWYFVMGVDFGFDPDPFAWVLWAWSPKIDDAYEMGSWKRARLIPDQMRDHLRGVYDQVADRLVVIRGDAGGALAKAEITSWAEVIKLPIMPADKHDKGSWQQLYNGELYAGRLHYRVGSALLEEQRHLQWRVTPQGKREEWADRTIDARDDVINAARIKPGNHCCDAGLYGWRDIAGRRTEHSAPPATPEERDAAMLRRVSREMDRAWRARQEGAP